MTEYVYEQRPPALIIEADPEIRRKYCTLVDTSFIYRLDSCYSCLEDALHRIPHLDNALILLGKNAHAAKLTGMTQLIMRANSRVKLLVVGDILEDPRSILAAGASGYVTADVTPVDFRDAFFQVSIGKLALAPVVSRNLVAAVQESTNHRLTRAELRTLREWIYCKSRAEVASDLGVSVGTVSRQLHTIYRKLDVHTREAVIRRAEQLLKPQSFSIAVSKRKAVL